jgi:hypothetical protein
LITLQQTSLLDRLLDDEVFGFATFIGDSAKIDSGQAQVRQGHSVSCPYGRTGLRGIIELAGGLDDRWLHGRSWAKAQGYV